MAANAPQNQRSRKRRRSGVRPTVSESATSAGKRSRANAAAQYQRKWQKQQTGISPFEADLERDGARENRDHRADAVKGVQPVHSGRSSIRIEHCYDRAEDHVENAGPESQPEYGQTQDAVIRRQRHANQADDHDNVPSDRKPFSAPAVCPRTRDEDSKHKTDKTNCTKPAQLFLTQAVRTAERQTQTGQENRQEIHADG